LNAPLEELPPPDLDENVMALQLAVYSQALIAAARVE
jgi:hypothetical protein